MRRLIVILLLASLIASTANAQITLPPLNQKPLLGTQLSLGHSLASDLIGCWVINEGVGSVVNDLSGNGNHLVSTNNAWGSGAITFAGTGYALGPATSNQPFIGATAFTVVVIGTVNNDTADHALIGCVDAGASWYSSGWLIYIDDVGVIRNDTISFYMANSDVVYDRIEGATGSSHVGKRTFWAATFAGGKELRLYVNGRQDDNSPVSTSLPHLGDPDYRLTVGRVSDGRGKDLDGSIEYIALYKRALSAYEIAQLYDDPFCMFRPITKLDVLAAFLGGEAGGTAIIDILNTIIQRRR